MRGTVTFEEFDRYDDAVAAWNRGDLAAIPISLTGPNSHSLLGDAGRGDVVVGPAAFCHEPSDLVVEPGAEIDWSALSPFRVPAGYRWPRHLVHVGEDAGVFAWAAGLEDGPLEKLTWRPRSSVEVDASDARIDELVLEPADSAELSMRLPAGLRTLHLRGDLGRFDLDLADATTVVDSNDLYVSLTPTTSPHPDATPLALPPLPALGAARRIEISNLPCRQPIDLEGLTRWTMLRAVSISGSVTGLHALCDLPALGSVELRAVDDLSEMPDLAELDLEYLFAADIEKSDGAWLRQQCKDLGMAKTTTDTWVGFSISQLRSRSWFESEYRLPFSGWPGRHARAAKRAFKAAERDIVGADKAVAVEVLERFGATIGTLPGMGTAEREDARVAYDLLLEAAGLELEPRVVDEVFGRTCEI